MRRQGPKSTSGRWVGWRHCFFLERVSTPLLGWVTRDDKHDTFLRLFQGTSGSFCARSFDRIQNQTYNTGVIKFIVFSSPRMGTAQGYAPMEAVVGQHAMRERSSLCALLSMLA